MLLQNGSTRKRSKVRFLLKSEQIIGRVRDATAMINND